MAAVGLFCLGGFSSLFVLTLGRDVLRRRRRRPYDGPWLPSPVPTTDGGALPADERRAAEKAGIERIAALEPDLILGLNSGLTRQDYDTLSDIAPTVAQPKGYIDYGAPWQEQTRTIGRALGREERADEVVSEVESRFAAVRENHPRFSGASGVIVGANGQGDSYFPAPYNPQDVRGRFMDALGFEQPRALRELAGDAFFTELSREQLGLVDAEVLVWVDLGAGFDAVRDDPLYQQLDAVREGRDVFLDDEVLNGALSFGTVLSLPFVLDGLVPRIAAAIDGDPETTTPDS